MEPCVVGGFWSFSIPENDEDFSDNFSVSVFFSQSRSLLGWIFQTWAQVHANMCVDCLLALKAPHKTFLTPLAVCNVCAVSTSSPHTSQVRILFSYYGSCALLCRCSCLHLAPYTQLQLLGTAMASLALLITTSSSASAASIAFCNSR